MKNIYTDLARKSIKYFLLHNSKIKVPNNLISELISKKAGVFVSIHKKNPKPDEEDLLGCIGTFLPTKKNIAEEIIDNAVSAATKDRRFSPITIDELDNLEISVDILQKPEPIQGLSCLEPKTYGVIVKTDNGKTGLLLPDLEGIDSPEYQVAIARQKAGISENEQIYLFRFKVDRHKE